MKRIKAFTLVEMLIVMGIIVILIGTALMVSRWAIRRSNKISHMDAVRNLEAALLTYRNENGYIPKVLLCGADNPPSCYADEFFTKALGDATGSDDIISQYLEEKPFDGGTDATYYYTTDSQGQLFVVCASLGGFDDENEWGYYCRGSGLGALPSTGADGPITKEEIEPDDLRHVRIIQGDNVDDSDWYKDEQRFGISP